MCPSDQGRGRISAACITADRGISRAILRRQGAKGPDVQAVAAESVWEYGRELAAVLVAMEAGNLWCVLECELLDFGIVERIVDLVPVPDVGRMCSVDAAGGLHVPDNLFSCDLGVVVVLVDGEY